MGRPQALGRAGGSASVDPGGDGAGLRAPQRDRKEAGQSAGLFRAGGGCGSTIRWYPGPAPEPGARGSAALGSLVRGERGDR
jgi:hypothetical protein